MKSPNGSTMYDFLCWVNHIQASRTPDTHDDNIWEQYSVLDSLGRTFAALMTESSPLPTIDAAAVLRDAVKAINSLGGYGPF